MNRLSAIALLAFLAAAPLLAQVSDSDIVKNAFPSDLEDGDGVRYSRYITADLNHDGQPLIVAVYTNGARGIVRVLNRAGQVLAEPNLRGMRGFHGSVRAIDLDGDGTPEIVVEMSSGHTPDNPESWIFRWKNGLNLITPTCPAGALILTCINRVSFIDLAGNGQLSILDSPVFKVDSSGHGVTSSGGWTLYSLSNGTFQRTISTYDFVREFHRAKGKPISSRRVFQATPGQATLHVVTQPGMDAATSGHVTLNGVEVLGPADFKRNSHVYDVPVVLLASNTLSVQLEGKPGSGVTVLMERAAQK